MVGVRDYRNSVSASNNEDIILRNLIRNKEKKQKRESSVSALKMKERHSTNNHSVVNQRRNSWMERRERHS